MENEDTAGIRAETSIQAVHIQDVWDYIKPAIDDILKDLPWKDFRAEDIYASCSAGDSAVFVDIDVPTGESFAILRMDENQSTKEKTLCLWISYSTNQETAKRVMDLIDTIASDSGCAYIEFVTGSEKLVEYGKIHGFDKVMYEVRKAVPTRQATEEPQTA